MRLVCCALLGCLVLLVAACGAGEPAPAPTAPLSPSVVASSPGATPSGVLPTTEVGELVVARVNGVPVLKRDFDRQVAAAHAFAREQGVDPDTDKGREMLKGLEVQILDSLIDQEIVSQAARRMGVAVSDEEVQRKVDEIVTQQGGREQFDKDLAASGVTYEDFVRDLRAQLDWQQMNAKIGQMVPDHAEQIHVRHIQLADEAAARDVLAKLQAGQDFVAVARQVSQDAGTKDQGGDLGWLPRGVLTPAFEEAAFALAPRQFSEPVQTPIGYHIIQVLEKEANRPVDAQLLEGLRQEAFMTWLSLERGRAKVERYLSF